MRKPPTPLSLALDWTRLAWEAQIVFAGRLAQMATGAIQPQQVADMATEKMSAFVQAGRAVLGSPDGAVAAERVILIYQKRVSRNLTRLSAPRSSARKQ